MIKILILHVEAGHGHRRAAEAIADEFKSRGNSGIQIEVFDALEKTNRPFKHFYPKIYHQMILWVPWLWGFFYFLTDLSPIYFILAPLRSLWNRFQARRLREYIKEKQFDFILFTHFFPAEVCARAKREGLIRSRLITAVTDVIPHAVWVNPGTDHYWVMAEESIELIAGKGISKELIFPGGIPISSHFITKPEKEPLREKLGLKNDRMTLLFTSGSFGTGPTEKILDSLQALGGKIQVLIVCGQNKSLFETLNKRRFSFPIFLFGFVNNMPELMSVSDLLIAKPGGMTMCESLVKGIPIIIIAPIPGQETYNAKWLLKRRAAFQVKRPNEIKDIVSRLIDDAHLFESTQSAIAQIAKPYAARDLVDFVLKNPKGNRQ